MSFDAQKYLKYLDACDLTEEQKVERIESIRKIFEDRIDIAFGTHPVQQCLGDSSEKDLQSQNEAVESASLSKYFRNEPASQLKRNKPLHITNSESRYHAEPR